MLTAVTSTTVRSMFSLFGRSSSTSVSRPSVSQVNEHYQNLPLDEKRRLYVCKDNYVTLESVPTWPQYAVEHNLRTHSSLDADHQYEICDTLNNKVSVWIGDICRLEIDAVVNAANSSLLGGGGVDGAIHRAAGDNLKRECREMYDGCDTGDAVITCGYKLPAKYCIHTVGPMDEHPKLLESCYNRSLQLLRQNNLRSIAFCCISTGIYGYPNAKAARIALRTAREWLEHESNAAAIDRIIFCLFMKQDIALYHRFMADYFPMSSSSENEDKKSPDARKKHYSLM